MNDLVDPTIRNAVTNLAGSTGDLRMTIEAYKPGSAARMLSGLTLSSNDLVLVLRQGRTEVILGKVS